LKERGWLNYGMNVVDSLLKVMSRMVFFRRELRGSAVTGRTFQVRAGFGFLPQKSGGFRVNPPDYFFWAGGWSDNLNIN